MKFKHYLICTVIVCFVLGYIQYRVTHPTKDNATNNKKVEELQKEVDKVKQKEYEEKVQQTKLLALQNPEIINKELQKTGKLISYEGKVHYEDVIKQNSFWGSKQVNLNLEYRFGISIMLDKIKVVKIIEQTAILQIPKSELKLEYIELIPDESKATGNKSWMEKHFTPTDTGIMLEQAQSKVKDQVVSNKAIFDKAMEGLKESLDKLIKQLNYTDVISEEL